MTGRLIVGALAWLAAASLLAAGLQQQPGRARSHLPPWVVTRKLSYGGVLVIEAHARRDMPASAVAAALVEPLRDRRYAEILVYIQQPAGWRRTILKRFQWTPDRGFSELVITPAPYPPSGR